MDFRCLTSRKHLRGLFKHLTIRERIIISCYKIGLSFKQIGKIVGLSKEGVRQIYLKTRGKL